MNRRRLLLVGAFFVLGVAQYAFLLLPGEPEVGHPQWGPLAIWLVLLWFLARGSAVAWVLALAVTLWEVLGLIFISPGLSFQTAAFMVCIALQLMILLAPSLRPNISLRSGGPHRAH